VVTVAASDLGEQLVAYVVPAPGAQVVSGVLLDALREVLPVYMVPAAVVVLDAFPLNTSGKLDRKALPAPVFETKEFRAPSTPIEEIVAGVFAEVLGVQRVGADDDFFALGGNSLIATQVAARLAAALDTQVPVRLLFEASTVTALAAVAETATGRGDLPVLARRERPERVPLSLAQQRMWFLNRFDQQSAAYNLPMAIRLSGALDVDALRAAVADVLERHEALRTRYPVGRDELPYQEVLPVGQVISGGLEIATADDPVTRIAELMSAGFDVTEAAPVRVLLLATGPDEHVLAMVVHHIAADGSSVGPLTRDLMTAYAARTVGELPGWAALPVQYADYALWQRELLGDDADPESLSAAQIDYWQSALAGVPDQLDLPVDRPRPAVQSFAGSRVEVAVDAEVHAGLVRVAQERNATLFMVVHSALAVLLSRLSGSDDVTVGTPVAGRGEQALDGLIGMFVNTLVFRTELDRGESFAELLSRQREADIAAFAHADVPFERLVEVLNPARSTARHPLFQVGFTFQNLAQSSLELPGLTVSGVEFDSEISQFDLNLVLGDSYDESGAPQGVAGYLTYATALFDHATVEGFAQRFARLLREIVAAPETAVGDLEILAPVERAQVLAQWNATEHAIRAGLLLDGFNAVAAAHPDRVAVSFEGTSLSYGEFAGRVNQLARYLIAEGV
ncbi:condensation domain-containing protein, partial [Nocardia jinanensis]|uniref:condensation domain-containing protein n=1 Tax=Nocardia jinanensis TaxID=382504 RepID=UPI001E62B84C